MGDTQKEDQAILSETWMNFDSGEWRYLLEKQIGGQGQFDEHASTVKLYFSLAEASCRITLTFREKKVLATEPGPAFDAAQWDRLAKRLKPRPLPGR